MSATSGNNDICHNNEALFSALYEQSCDAQFILQNSRCIDCNNKALELFKMENKSDFLNTHPNEFSPNTQPDGKSSLDKANDKIAQCVEQGFIRFPWVHQDADKNLYWTEVTLTLVNLTDGAVIHANVRFREKIKDHIYNEKESSEEPINKTASAIENYVLLNEYKRAIDQSSIVSKTNVKGVITYVNDRFCEVSGYSRSELLGQPHNIINHPETPKSLFASLWKTIKSGNIWQGIIQNRKKNGDSYYVDSSITPIMDAKGKITEFIAIRNDITPLYEQEKLIMFQHTDELTGLPNRTKLRTDLDQNPKGHLALLKFAGLKEFENVYPNHVFKQVLDKITKMIKEHFEQLNTNVTTYKISNTEYAVLCNGSLSPKGFQYQIESLIYFLMMVNLTIEGFTIPIRAVAGWSSAQSEGERFQNAQLALQSCISDDQHVVEFNQENNNILQEIHETINWTTRLKNAIHEENIALFAQTIVDKNGRPYSNEVLMRIHDVSKNEYISPFFFLEYAKKSQIYAQLSRIVISKSILHYANNDARFSVNVTCLDLLDSNTRELIINLVEQHQIGDRLILELVESEELNFNDQHLNDFLLKLKQLGVHVAIDDFGSGYSNFNYFTQLPVDIVKIDGSIIKNIDKNDKHYVLVKSIVHFCHDMGIKVVAEYVENESIFNTLIELEVDYFQGYYFHQPELINLDS